MTRAGAIEVDEQLLRSWPLPQPAGAAGKHRRGRVLVVAGCREMPGSAILCADAALRAGAGMVTVVTAAGAAASVAQAVPEARVVALPETPTGAIAGPIPREAGAHADCVVVGPGLAADPPLGTLVTKLLQRFARVPVLLDAGAMDVLAAGASPARRLLITPHSGELAHLGLGTRTAIEARPRAAARAAARRWQCLVVLKGPVTHIAREGRDYRHRGGNAGLGISGSGDVLAGIIGGLAARGASLEQAAAWGVALHARAGEALAVELGPLGYLARELAAKVPRLMAQLGA